MGLAHVIDESVLVHSDLAGVHIGDDRAQYFSQRNELRLRHGGHLHRGQITWNKHRFTLGVRQVEDYCSACKHTWLWGVSLFTRRASENNSPNCSWHSSANHFLNHGRGGLFMWVIWTMPDWFWNSISPGTDRRIPLLPQKWPQLGLHTRSHILPPIAYGHALIGGTLRQTC